MKRPGRGWGTLAGLLLAAAGCQREEIQVYRVPKPVPVDAAPMAGVANGAPGAPGMERPVPQLGWQLPKDWQEAGHGEFSLASFNVQDAKGRKADISVTQLGNLAGKDALLVNMWREQAGAPALSDAEAVKQMQPVTVGAESGNLFEVSGQREGAAVKIITAMVHRPEGSWFYKLAGEPTLVDEQKPAFLDFLKSIQIRNAPAAAAAPPMMAGGAGPMAGGAPMAGGGGGGPLPEWQPPANWQTAPPGQMLRAKFVAPGPGGTSADVNIGSAGGGALLNLARWRRQLSLPAVTDAELQAALQPLAAGGDKALLLDISGTNALNQKPARLVGVMVSHGGEDWYYKLMGDGPAVEAEKAAFLQFVKGVKYPHAP